MTFRERRQQQREAAAREAAEAQRIAAAAEAGDYSPAFQAAGVELPAQEESAEWPALIGLEQLRHCDVKECPHCHTLISLRALELESRPSPDGAAGLLEAVWCPHCSEPLLDRMGYIEQRAEQRAYDRERARRGAAEVEPGEGEQTEGEDTQLDDDEASESEPPRAAAARRREHGGV